MNNFDKIIGVRQEKLLLKVHSLNIKIATLELERARAKEKMNKIVLMHYQEQRKRAQQGYASSYSNELANKIGI